MIKKITSLLSSSRKLSVLILLLGLTASVFAVGLMFVAGYLIGASADNVYSLLMLNIPLAFVQIFGLGKPIARYFERLESHDWVLHLTSKLRFQLFQAAQERQRSGKKLISGEALGSLASDIENVQNLYLRSVFPVLIAWLVGLLLVVISGFFSIPLLIFALGILVLVAVLIPLLSALENRARIVALSEERAVLYADVTDSVFGAQDIAIAGRGAEESRNFLSRFAAIEEGKRILDRKNRARLLLIQFFLLAALVFLIAWATDTFGHVSGGSANWIIAVALGFFPLIEIFAPLSKQCEDSVSHLKSLDRLEKRMGGTVESSSEQTSVHSRSLDIAIHDLSFSYAGDEKDHSQPVLRDISLTIPESQKIAILGKSGSGKSTLASLIHGDLLPTQGEITIGGFAVHDLKDNIWEYVGLISQDSYLFAMTIMDNLRLAKPDLSEKEAWVVLDSVGLKSYFESLPDKLQTNVTEAGMRFSGGQQQRLALARVLLQDCPIVVLDEPTVGLDPITEQLVMDTILETLKNKTVVMITHHLQGVDAFDRVVFIEGGSLEMDGSPDTLKQTNERYQKLFKFDKGLMVSAT